MAQFFTVHFPKFHFVQKEFSITFAAPLPFIYAVAHDGIVYVEHVNWKDPRYADGETDAWRALGLQEGLTIVAVHVCTEEEALHSPLPHTHEDETNHNGTYNEIDQDDDEEELDTHNGHNNTEKEKHDGEAEDDEQKKLQLKNTDSDDVESILNHHNIDGECLFITFREELYAIDDAQPLGLSWNTNQRQFTQAQLAKSSQMELLHIVTNRQISASSCQAKYEPYHCRLNHPTACWRPSLQNELLRDVWISFDLGMKQIVTQICIQGSLEHTQYVTRLWLDFSDDGCKWHTHPMRCVQCRYNEEQYAIIKVWPSIHAQFIRLRPSDWHNHVALRAEIYGSKTQQIQFGRVVTLNTIHPKEKQHLMEMLKHKSPDTKVIQVNLKAVVCAALDRAGLRKYSVLKGEDGHYIIVFTTSGGLESERAMDFLAEAGIGREVGVVSVSDIKYRSAPISVSPELDTKIVAGSSFANLGMNTGTKFYETIKSRMVVKQIVENIMHSAGFTFDYLLLLLSASLIAVAGLAINSSVAIVASMLVSPLMGPVLAFTFGVTLKQRTMADLGLKNELFSLLICISTGFVVGYFYALCTMNRNHWPTDEMASRGQIVALADGAYIAAASGVGVALSVLGDYISTVVGVAISASLLPPAVNCGMLLAFVLYEISFPQFVHGENTPVYDREENIFMALISLTLTIENVIIIFVVSRCMFWIKNVYIPVDHNRDVWQSVFNIKHQYEHLQYLQNSENPLLKQALKRPFSEIYGEHDHDVTEIQDTHVVEDIDTVNTTGKAPKWMERRKTSIRNLFLSPDNSVVNPEIHNVILKQQTLRFRYSRSARSTSSTVSIDHHNFNELRLRCSVDENALVSPLNLQLDSAAKSNERRYKPVVNVNTFLTQLKSPHSVPTSDDDTDCKQEEQIPFKL